MNYNEQLREVDRELIKIKGLRKGLRVVAKRSSTETESAVSCCQSCSNKFKNWTTENIEVRIRSIQDHKIKVQRVSDNRTVVVSPSIIAIHGEY